MLSTVAVPEDLKDRVFTAIHQASIRRLRRRFIVLGSAFCGIFGFIIAAFSFIAAEAQASQMSAYLRFLWTDSDVVLSNLGEYFRGLLESIPIGSLALIVACVMLLLGAVGFAQALYRSTHRRMSNHSFAV